MNSNNKFKFLFLVLMLTMLVVPMFASADLVPCGKGVVGVGPDGKPAIVDECNWNSLMTLVNHVINFIFIDMSIPIAAIMFAYAGVLLVTAGGESASAKTKAKGIFSGAVTGLLLIAVSWLIIHLILTTLGYDGSWIGF